jgi:hypothetical protein
VGIGLVQVPATLKLGVAGNVGADKYCDQNGNNCIDAATLGGSGSSFWTAIGNDIKNTNTGDVVANSGTCYYRFSNGALHTNCNVVHDIPPSTATFSGSINGLAWAQNHCLSADGSHINYYGWCGASPTEQITISGCSISGAKVQVGYNGGTMRLVGNGYGMQVFDAYGNLQTTWTSTCSLTGGISFPINVRNNSTTIQGSGSSIIGTGNASGVISLTPAHSDSTVWGTSSGQKIYQCPVGMQGACSPGSCNGQLTSMATCIAYTYGTTQSEGGGYNCDQPKTQSCSLILYTP